MSAVWILRSLRADGYEQLAFERSFVAIGWGTVGDLASHTDRSELRDLVRAAYPFVGRDAAESYADQLFQFRVDLKPGDLVLLLRRSSPDIAVGRVTGEYRFRTDLHSDVRHIRSVRWIRHNLGRLRVEREVLASEPLAMISLVGGPDVAERVVTLAETADLAASLESNRHDYRPANDESNPFANFQQNLNYARSLATAGQHLAELKVSAFEVTDVFRAAWVQGIAALDHWVRQEVRVRMLALARDRGAPKPKGFSAFQLSLEQVERVLKSRASLADVLEEQLTLTRGHLAYQHPAKIREAFSLVADVSDFWGRVAKVFSERAADSATISGMDVQNHLTEIVQRRNKIAHEYDENPCGPPSKRPIDAASVTQTIDWIEQVGASILVILVDEGSQGDDGR